MDIIVNSSNNDIINSGDNVGLSLGGGLNPDINKFELMVKEVIQLHYHNRGQFVDKDIIANDVAKILPCLSRKYQIVLKKRVRRNLKDEDMCMGRKIDGGRCTRHKLGVSSYCKSHQKNLPNGRIDDNVPLSNSKTRRGRKPKTEFDIRANNPEYLKTYEAVVDGDKYLVDNDNNVFTFDLDAPEFVGKRSKEGHLIKTAKI